MIPRSNRLTAWLLAGACAAAALPLAAQTPPEAQRISFQIATGPISGSYLFVGETIAGIVSSPQGTPRCETPGVCGPAGLIATSRSSSGSVANAIAVSEGRVQSALIQGDVASAAFAGEGPFQETGALKNLRTIARLHEETLHLVVSVRTRVRKLSDLAGKRVAIDAAKSGTNYTVRRLLRAARVDASRIKLRLQSAEQAAADLRDGKLDAFFTIGVAPVRAADGLIRRGQARLAPIDAKAASALAKSSVSIRRYTLPADSYRSSKATATLNIDSVWVVNASLPADIARGLLRSLWHPANRNEFRHLGKVAETITAARAGENPPVPLHEGAQRFYGEAVR